MHASCLCGDIEWDYDGELAWMSHCHCSRCRKAHGAAFATYTWGPADRFRLHGRAKPVRWESSPGYSRSFCGRCGSTVPGDPFDGSVFLPAGSFDGDPGVRPQAHIFVGSKAPWYAIPDALERHDAYPPAITDAPQPDPPALAPSPDGSVRGSCGCGAVAYAYTGDPVICRNCHCGRCRKARSAAHASNLAVPLDRFRWLRGEARLGSYKVPEAQFFAQVFCTTCGGPMPRTDASRGIAIVPMGSLDDDPRVAPRNHIFVGSKAPWFEIADDLPQYEEQQPA
jgi:hypothetical protein